MRKIKLFISFIVFSVLFLGTNVFAFTEGVDYVKLESPIEGAENSVVKVYNYACPFCYKYDKAVTVAMLKKTPEGTVFAPYHLSTKGDFGKEASLVLATLMVIDEDAKVDITSDASVFKKAKFAMYQGYHDKKKRWKSGDEFIADALAPTGISIDTLNDKKADARVAKLLETWEKYSYDIAKIQGVPAFVVNGKWLVYTSKIRNIDGFANLVNELLKK